MAVNTSSRLMFPQWEDFTSGVPSRLMLPLAEFSYIFEYVPLALEPGQRRYAQMVVTDAVVEALRTEPECSLTALRVVTSTEGNADHGDNYFGISYTSPVFNFMIQMGPTSVQMAKARSTLQNLLLTSRLFAQIANALFPVAEAGERGPSPFEEAGVHINGVRLSFAWSHNLVLGVHLGNEREANNVELIEQLLRLGGGASGRDVRQPLSGVDPGAIRRGDINLGYTKELAGCPRQLWFSVESPWNVTQKDVDILVIYRLGESDSPLKGVDLCDFRTPFIAFYRDEVLKGFFSELFADIEVAGRP